LVAWWASGRVGSRLRRDSVFNTNRLLTRAAPIRAATVTVRA